MSFFLYSKGRRVSERVFLGDFQRDEPGVFESLRTYGGCIFREEEHLGRLEESAATAGVRLPPLKEIRREMHAAVRAYRRSHPEGDLFIRISIWRSRVYTLVGRRTHPAEIYASGVALKTTSVRRFSPASWAPQAKTNAYQNAVLAALQPRAGSYENLFLDSQGYVAEVSIGNIFIVKGKGVFTPPAQGILNGVTRRFVIKCALPAGMKAEETPLTRHDVYNADEVFLTNTSWEILPVKELDGRRIGRSVPGPKTLEIHQLFKKKVAIECRIPKYAEP